MIRRNASIALGATMVLAGLVAQPAIAEHSWNDFHWARTANPVALQVVDSVTSEWQASFDGSLSEWGKSSAFDFTVGSTDGSKRARRQCKPVTGQMRVCNDSYGFNGWLGVAQVWLDGNSHIAQGIAKMNDSYSTTWTDQSKRNHVMCQEIGHVLGLGHTSEDGTSQETCMDYSWDPNSQWPNQHDYDQLAAMYAHTDSYNSYDDGSSSGGGGDDGGGGGPPCDKKPDHPKCAGSWGRLTHSDANHETWVRRSGNGIVITHVRLAG